MNPGKSSLFFLTGSLLSMILENGLAGDKEHGLVEYSTFGISGAFMTTLENPRELLNFVPGRTHNRSRSPR